MPRQRQPVERALEERPLPGRIVGFGRQQREGEQEQPLGGVGAPGEPHLAAGGVPDGERLLFAARSEVSCPEQRREARRGRGRRRILTAERREAVVLGEGGPIVGHSARGGAGRERVRRAAVAAGQRAPVRRGAERGAALLAQQRAHVVTEGGFGHRSSGRERAPGRGGCQRRRTADAGRTVLRGPRGAARRAEGGGPGGGARAARVRRQGGGSRSAPVRRGLVAGRRRRAAPGAAGPSGRASALPCCRIPHEDQGARPFAAGRSSISDVAPRSADPTERPTARPRRRVRPRRAGPAPAARRRGARRRRRARCRRARRRAASHRRPSRPASTGTGRRRAATRRPA